RFARSLVPAVDPISGQTVLARDEGPRPDTTAAGLAELLPSFAGMGATPVGPHGETLDDMARAGYSGAAGGIRPLHTAGNSSGLADGAAAVAVASERWVRERGIKARARIRAMATIGSDPVLMLTGPAPASEKALR